MGGQHSVYTKSTSEVIASPAHENGWQYNHDDYNNKEGDATRNGDTWMVRGYKDGQQM